MNCVFLHNVQRVIRERGGGILLSLFRLLSFIVVEKAVLLLLEGRGASQDKTIFTLSLNIIVTSRLFLEMEENGRLFP